MKKYSWYLILLLLVPSILQASCATDNNNETFSRTYMATRPIIQHPSLYWSIWHNIIYPHDEYRRASVQTTAIGQWSFPMEETTYYFLPCCNNIIIVAGDNSTTSISTSSFTCERTVRAEWVGLPSDFYGSFQIAPQQWQQGLFIEFNKNLTKMLDWIPNFANSWVSIAANIASVENRLNFQQLEGPDTCLCAEGSGPIYEAFNQPNWYYGHFRNQTSTLQLAELNIKFGRAYLAQDHFLVAYYSLLSLPTGNTQDPRYLFDAVSGNNGHWGYGVGVNFQILLNKDPYCYATCLFVNLETTFFPRADEQRIFDLKDKHWSRYLLLVDRCGSGYDFIPAVNILTRTCRVHPYNYVEFSTGIRVKTPKTELEVGYNIWGHADEWIELRCPFPSGKYGIAGRPGPDGMPQTASRSTISNQAPNDDEFIALCESDLDIESGEAKSALNQKVHFSFGYINEGEVYDGFFGFGLFLDSPLRNTALKTFAAWAKLGASF